MREWRLLFFEGKFLKYFHQYMQENLIKIVRNFFVSSQP